MDEVYDSIQKANAAKRAHIAESFSNSDAILNENVITKAEMAIIEKAVEAAPVDEVYAADKTLWPEDDENPFNKAAEGDIEKSDIMYALEAGGNAITITKSGKQLKAKAKELLAKHDAKLVAVEAQADALLVDCGSAPTQEIGAWQTAGIKFEMPFKKYSWEECQYNESSSGMVSNAESLAPAEKQKLGVNCPANAEEAVARRKYNEVIDKMTNVYTDIKALEFIDNLEDGKQFQLTPRQAVTLGFM